MGNVSRDREDCAIFCNVQRAFRIRRIILLCNVHIDYVKVVNLTFYVFDYVVSIFYLVS